VGVFFGDGFCRALLVRRRLDACGLVRRLRFSAGRIGIGCVGDRRLGVIGFGNRDRMQIGRGETRLGDYFGTVGTAEFRMTSAACMYFSSSIGETVSTSPMVSKP